MANKFGKHYNSHYKLYEELEDAGKINSSDLDAAANKDGKYSYAAGTKGYKFLESNAVKGLHKENYICKDYYYRLVDDAIATINEFGDAEQFRS